MSGCLAVTTTTGLQGLGLFFVDFTSTGTIVYYSMYDATVWIIS